MITIPAAFKQAIADDSKKYLCYADITLANKKVLNLTNVEMWESGFSKEDAVSDDNKFTALGATIIGSAEISIKNQNEEYSSYDFTNAKVVLWVSAESVAGSKIRIGTYTVDEMHYTEASIRLTMLDNMEQFDRPYSNSSLAFPATLFQIVQNLCTTCGVTLATTSIPHGSFSIPERPLNEGITCREVLGMAAAIAGCFCRCNPLGQLELKWFNRSTLDSWRNAYARGSATQLAGMHYFTSLFSQDISVDDVVITGVRTIVEKMVDGKAQQTTLLTGSSGYIVSVEKNELLNACSDTDIDQVRGWLATQLNGLTFRRVSISHISDPSIEAGDIGAVWDRRGRGFPLLVTRTNFAPGNQQHTVSGAETPSRNAATRYGYQTKAYVESKKQLNAEQSIREQIEKEFKEAIENAAGMYYTAVVENGATIYYLHNFPELEDSPVRIMFSTAGISVTADGTSESPHWFGLTPSGTMLVNLLRTTGFSFDWAQGGTLTLGGQDNINGELRVLDANGNQIGVINNAGMSISGNLSVKNGTATITGGIGTINRLEVLIVEGTVRWKDAIGFAIKHLNSSNNILSQHAIFADSNGVEEQIYTSGTWTKMIAFGRGAISGQAPAIGWKIHVTSDGSFILTDLYGSASEAKYNGKKGTYLPGLSVSGTANIHGTLSVPAGASASFSGTASVSGSTISSSTISDSTIKNTKISNNSVTVTSSGVTIGNTVLGDSTTLIDIELPATGSSKVQLGDPSRATAAHQKRPGLLLSGEATLTGSSGGLVYNGTSVQLASSSSRRYKHSIKPIEDKDLDPHKLLDLTVVQFVFNGNHPVQYADMKGKMIPGLIAEDVAETYPAAAITKVNDETGEMEIESWDERRIIPGMLSLIQEQHSRIKELESRVKRLEKIIEKMCK